MKLFLKNLLLPNLKETILRFPIPLACVLIFTVLSFLRINDIVLVGLKNDRDTLFYLPLFWGFFAFLALKLFVENHNVSRKYHALLIVCVAAFIVYVCYTPNIGNLLLLLAGLICILLVAPYILNDNSESACCHFNTRVAISVFFSVLSAIILCAGISLIVASITYLFDVKMSGNIYGNTWLIGMSLFAPFYALSGIPKEFTHEDQKYPKGISFIFSYIIAPLILVYFAILYAYMAKILIGWELPKGKVAYMVTSFGIIGIFTHLFSYPLKDTGSALIRAVQSYFYYVLLAPIALLFIGIGVRIRSYGITEERYIIVLLAIWFLASAMYIIINKNHKIKVILLMIGSMLIASSFGMWGAESISIRSQISRLEDILERNNLLKNGIIIKPAHTIPFADQKEVSSIVEYIAKSKKIKPIKEWFSSDSYINTTQDTQLNITKLMEDIGVPYVSKYQQEGNYESFHFLSPREIKLGNYGLTNIKGFDYYANINTSLDSNFSWSKVLENPNSPDKNLELYQVSRGVLGVKYPDKDRKVHFEISNIVSDLLKSGVRNGEITDLAGDFIAEDKGFKVRLCITSINGNIKNGEPVIKNSSFSISVKYPD